MAGVYGNFSYFLRFRVVGSVVSEILTLVLTASSVSQPKRTPFLKYKESCRSTLMEGTVSKRRIFTQEKLAELSQMLAEGVPVYSIAKHFNCDCTSVTYQVKKILGKLPQAEIEKRRERAREYKAKYKTLRNRKGHCKRCEILLEYAREGKNETYCGECLNEMGIL